MVTRVIDVQLCNAQSMVTKTRNLSCVLTGSPTYFKSTLTLPIFPVNLLSRSL